MLCAVPVVSILYYNIIDRENPVLYTKYYKTVQVQEFVSTNDVLLHCTMGVCMYVSRWAHRPGKATNLHSWPFRCLSKIRDLQVWPGVSHHSSIAHVHTRDKCLDGLFFFYFPYQYIAWYLRGWSFWVYICCDTKFDTPFANSSALKITRFSDNHMRLTVVLRAAVIVLCRSTSLINLWRRCVCVHVYYI